MSEKIRFLADQDLETVRERYRNYALRHTGDINEIKEWMKTMTSDGRFPGIDYNELSASQFSLKYHLINTMYMARAYVDERGELYLNKELKTKIDAAVKDWTDHRYQTYDDWWDNQIGTPRFMINILFMLDGYLSEEQTKAMIEVANDANLQASGARPSADRIIICELILQTELLKRNEKGVEDIMKVVSEAINFRGEDKTEILPQYLQSAPGLERDYCYHHRPDCVNNTLDYGLIFIDNFMSIATRVYDTKYKLDVKFTKILIDYFLDGICKQMVYSCYKDQNLKNRDFGIEQNDYNRESTEIIKQLITIEPNYRREELENAIKLRTGEYEQNSKIIPSYAKVFWSTELLTYQRPNFYTSVRMFSARNKNMEYPFNGEGITNHFRGDGGNYLQVTGKEYINIAPVWDFRKIPGTTIMQDTTMPAAKEMNKYGPNILFAGGVTDNMYGSAAFDFHAVYNDLHAKKSWFFFDNEYMCLGANITSNESKEIFTTLEQNYHEGDVTVKTNSQEEIMTLGKEKNYTDGKVKWVHHGKAGYYFVEQPEKVGLFNKQVIGNWKKTNQYFDAKTEDIKENIFALWINHGKKITNKTYAYAILPNVTVDQVKNYNLPIDVLANNGFIQAIRHKQLEMDYIVFYQSGKIKVTKDIEIAANSSCMVMLKENKGKIKEISVSDPERNHPYINLKIKGKFTSDNSTYVKYSYNDENDFTDTTFNMPRGYYNGSSISISNDYEYSEDNSKTAFWIIGIVCFVVIIAGLGFFFCRKKKLSGKEIEDGPLLPKKERNAH